MRLQVDDPPEGSLVESDEALLSQVLRNLLHNAVKFTERGSVRLTVGRVLPMRSAKSWRPTGNGISTPSSV